MRMMVDQTTFVEDNTTLITPALHNSWQLTEMELADEKKTIQNHTLKQQSTYFLTNEKTKIQYIKTDSTESEYD